MTLKSMEGNQRKEKEKQQLIVLKYSLRPRIKNSRGSILTVSINGIVTNRSNKTGVCKETQTVHNTIVKTTPPPER